MKASCDVDGEIKDKNSEKLVDACASSNIETFSPTNASTRLHRLHWAKTETQIVHIRMHKIFRRSTEYAKKGVDGASGDDQAKTEVKEVSDGCKISTVKF